MCQLFRYDDVMSPEVRWLSVDEQRLWRRWLLLNNRLSATVQRELQDDSGLSNADFEVLVNLTDNPDGRIRVTDLATKMVWERSRLSHQVTRMERRALVERVECKEDGRGAWIVITPSGRTAIEKAAPGHVETVRTLVFDSLTGDDVSSLATLVDKLLAGLDEEPAPQ